MGDYTPSKHGYNVGSPGVGGALSDVAHKLAESAEMAVAPPGKIARRVRGEDPYGGTGDDDNSHSSEESSNSGMAAQSTDASNKY